MAKRRAYVRLPDSVLREDWDDATLADMVRLQLFLNTRWARDRLSAKDAGRCFLGPQEMMLITRTTSVARAKKRLLGLPDRTGGVTLAVCEAFGKRTSATRLPTRQQPRGVTVSWPKFPMEQGYFDRDRPKSGPVSGPPLPPPPPPPLPLTKTPQPPAAQGAVSVSAETAWLRSVEAFTDYGKRLTSLSAARRKRLLAVVKEFGREAPAKAVHGYQAFHRVQSGGFDPDRTFTPETVFRPANIAKYLDAYDEAIAAGLATPFQRESTPARGANGYDPMRDAQEREDAWIQKPQEPGEETIATRERGRIEREF